MYESRLAFQVLLIDQLPLGSHALRGQDGGVGRLPLWSIEAEQWATKPVPPHFLQPLENSPFSRQAHETNTHKIIMKSYHLLMDYAHHAKHFECIEAKSQGRYLYWPILQTRLRAQSY